jgi:hypothetical protein
MRLIPLPWQLPSHTSAELVDQAWSALHGFPDLEEAKASDLALWLATLGALCGGKTSPDEAKVKISTYVDLLLDDFSPFPLAVLTKATAGRVAKRFDFFPTYKNLHRMLSEEIWELLEPRRRLEVIANANASPGRPDPIPRYSELSDDQRAAIDQKLAEYRAYRNRDEFPNVEGEASRPESAGHHSLSSAAKNIVAAAFARGGTERISAARTKQTYRHHCTPSEYESRPPGAWVLSQSNEMRAAPARRNASES